MLACCPHETFSQTLYSYFDQNGVRNFSNIPPATPVRDLTISGVPPEYLKPAPASSNKGAVSVDTIIEKYARQYELDPELIRSMIKTESDFNPKAVSVKGAQGLMQLMPATAARLGVGDPFDPEENIRGGAQHMRTLLDTFDNDLALSLAAYNAGENLVQRIGRIPDYRETHDYVRTVTRRYGKKEMAAPPAPDTPRPPEMFRYIDSDGVLHLSNIPPVEASSINSLALFPSRGTPERSGNSRSRN